MSQPSLLIVASPDDGLAVEVRRVVLRRGVPTVWHAPWGLAARRVALRESTWIVDSVPVAAVLWRVSPEMDLATAFAGADRRFATNETAATWIAALQDDRIAAVNRFDAHAWYSGLRSHYWCDRLRTSGVRVAPMCAGHTRVPPTWRWRPYTTDDECEPPEIAARAAMASSCQDDAPVAWHITVCGAIPRLSAHANVERAARLLHQWGVGLATIGSDASGCVRGVKVLPVLDDSPVLGRVAEHLGDLFDDHCAARRS